MKNEPSRSRVPEAQAFAPRRKNMVHLLLQTRERMMQHFRPILARYDLTEQQWRIVRNLAEVEEMEPHQLSREAGILGPSLVGVLERMGRSGLIDKKRHPSDQRRVIVSLTSRGKELYDDAWPMMQEVYDVIARQMGEEEMEHFLAALERFHDRLVADGSEGSDE